MFNYRSFSSIFFLSYLEKKIFSFEFSELKHTYLRKNCLIFFSLWQLGPCSSKLTSWSIGLRVVAFWFRGPSIIPKTISCWKFTDIKKIEQWLCQQWSKIPLTSHCGESVREKNQTSYGCLSEFEKWTYEKRNPVLIWKYQLRHKSQFVLNPWTHKAYTCSELREQES